MTEPKILLFDIETAPMLAWVWGLWKQNIPFSMLEHDWFMLTWSAKWLGSEDIHYDGNHLHGTPHDDTGILSSLHALLDEADIVVAHNGNKFDIKRVNARFVQAGFPPPSPYRKVDTLVEAKKHFAFSSNRLDSIAEALGLPRKLETGGFDLWARCLHGDEDAFEEMCEYNIRDVQVLEEVYLKLRPWMSNHPNAGVYNDEEAPQCPKCSSPNLHWRGYATTQAGRFHRFQCQDCGGWGRARFTTLEKEKRKTLVTNAQ